MNRGENFDFKVTFCCSKSFFTLLTSGFVDHPDPDVLYNDSFEARPVEKEQA